MRRAVSISIAWTCGLLFFAAPTLALGADEKPADIIQFFQPSGVVPALIVIVLAAVAIRLINGLMIRLGERFAERRLLAQQTNTILRFAIYIVALIFVVRSMFRLERETILALTGTLAVSVGFALKDLAASVLAGITISVRSALFRWAIA
jgi:small-conductance mechanosensitive channel